MSEATEVTEIVERVREHLAAAVGIGHPDEEGYIDFLTEILAALTAATQRADAAEARRDVWELRARKVVQERRTLRVECEALRKVVADVRAIKKIDSPCLDGENSDWVDGWQYGYQAALEDVRECITAASPALAVQPTTGEAK